MASSTTGVAAVDADGSVVQGLAPDAMEVETDGTRANNGGGSSALGMTVDGHDSDGDGDGDGDLRGPAIPSADAIFLAKKRRELARKAAEPEAFIPLVDRSGGGGSGHSRLLQVPLNDGEDVTDDRGPMSFGDAAKLTARADARAQARTTLEEGMDQGDAEFAAWEREKIYAGAAAAGGGAGSVPGVRRPQRRVSQSNSPRPSRTQVVEDPAKVVDRLFRRLTADLEDLGEVHRSHTQQLYRLEDDVAIIDKGGPALEEDLAAASGRYTLYQDAKGYISSMLDCLEEKVPQVQNAINTMHTVWVDRAAARAARNAKDHSDAAAACRAAVADPARPPLGPADGALAARMDRWRQQRRAVRAGAGAAGASAAVEGGGAGEAEVLTDSELLPFTERQLEARAEADGIFSDVIEEFCQIGEIAKRFEKWKLGQPGTYGWLANLRPSLVPIRFLLLCPGQIEPGSSASSLQAKSSILPFDVTPSV
jgi:GC-rich sequence DNA-binding factor